jgi:hypothetical protein
MMMVSNLSHMGIMGFVLMHKKYILYIMTLRSTYDDPKTTTRNAALLAKRSGTTVKSAVAFLKTLGSVQVNDRYHKPSPENYAPTGAPSGHWQSDVMFLEDYKGVNNKRMAILTVLNSTTRYAAARGLLNVKAASITAGLVEIIEELEKNGKNISVLRVDGGGEFKASTKTMLKKRKIELEVGEPNTHYRLARTDRFHRTLRERLGAHFEREDTHKWIDILPDIIQNINESPHRTLSEVLKREATPSSITSIEEGIIRSDELRRASALGEKVDNRTGTNAIIPGKTKVRILRQKTKNGSAFDKAHLNTWSTATYTVLERNGVNSYIVDVPNDVRVWPVYALKVVAAAADDEAKPTETRKSTASTRVTPKQQAVIRAKRLESRNISETEQAEALADQKVSDPRPTRVKTKPAKLRV